MLERRKTSKVGWLPGILSPAKSAVYRSNDGLNLFDDTMSDALYRNLTVSNVASRSRVWTSVHT